MLILHEFHVPYIPYTLFSSTAVDRKLQYLVAPSVPTEGMRVIFMKTHFHTPLCKTKLLECVCFKIYGVK